MIKNDTYIESLGSVHVMHSTVDGNVFKCFKIQLKHIKTIGENLGSCIKG